MANDIYNDHPVAVDATRALIKKIKKADADLQEQIDTAVSNEMKIAVGADGSNEMTFYKGTLV